MMFTVLLLVALVISLIGWGWSVHDLRLVQRQCIEECERAEHWMKKEAELNNELWRLQTHPAVAKIIDMDRRMIE